MNNSLEPVYDQFYQHILAKSPALDPDLAIRIMQIQRSLKKISPSRSKPHVNLYVKYRDGVKLDQKVEEYRDKYPIQSSVSRWQDGVILSGLMSIDNVQTIASDSDIVDIKGQANARHN